MDWNSQEVDDLIRRALAEDIGAGDATSLATIPAAAMARARIVAKAPAVCAGLPLVERVLRVLDPEAVVRLLAKDGDTRNQGRELAQIHGRARAIVSGERTVLNFLAHLCGIATLTGRFVERLEGTQAKIRDTRKTTPGLRALEKYAVRMGGGTNHRIGLYDAILLKENHIALAGGIVPALERAHKNRRGEQIIEIEVSSLEELEQALEHGGEAILLDNMPVEEVKRAVERCSHVERQIPLEVSGGITLENVRAYAETGVNFISVGVLTHSAKASDMGMRLAPV